MWYKCHQWLAFITTNGINLCIFVDVEYRNLLSKGVGNSVWNKQIDEPFTAMSLAGIVGVALWTGFQSGEGRAPHNLAPDLRSSFHCSLRGPSIGRGESAARFGSTVPLLLYHSSTSSPRHVCTPPVCRPLHTCSATYVCTICMQTLHTGPCTHICMHATRMQTLAHMSCYTCVHDICVQTPAHM